MTTSLASLALLAASSGPQSPLELAATPRAQPIYQGVAVEDCGWPTVVGMDLPGAHCSGVLVHPRLILYAAHCGPVQEIEFGDDYGRPGRTITPDTCVTNPDYTGATDQRDDIAFCVLETPIDELAVTPVLAGCETDMLARDVDVALVGFGETDRRGSGQKHWVSIPIRRLYSRTVEFEGGGCSGDSGGPALLQVPDGSWRAFGISSTNRGYCGSTATYTLIEHHLEWIEATSGIDITPCHDAAGNWEPSADCGGFHAGGEVDHGSWSTWCAGTPVSDLSETCGAPFGAGGDGTGTGTGTTSSTDTDDDTTGQDPDTSSEGGDASSGDATTAADGQGDADGGSDDGTTEPGTETDGAAAADDDAGGCGCTTRRRSPRWWPLAFAVAFIPAGRGPRRHRRPG